MKNIKFYKLIVTLGVVSALIVAGLDFANALHLNSLYGWLAAWIFVCVMTLVAGFYAIDWSKNN